MEGQESHEEVMNVRTRLWSYSFGCTKSMSIMVAIQLDIPDAVHSHDGPIPLPLLASAVGVPESKLSALRRLMRALSHCGVFHRVVKPGVDGAADEDAYSPTIFSKQLVKDNNPNSAAPFLVFCLYPMIVTTWYNMAAWLREDGLKPTCAFEAAHGGTFEESIARVPELREAFKICCNSDAHWVVGMVARQLPEVFQGVASLVDVGGGDGTMAKAIKDVFPEMTCKVLEHRHVLAASPVKGVEFVEGDMFEHVPQADAVLLKWTLLTLHDEDCVKILRRCREAVLAAKDRGGKVIIIESVFGITGGSYDHEAMEVQHLVDVHLLACVEGKERDEGEWRRLITAAGFSACKINPVLGLRSVIEAYP